jgi:putative MATE family efflux protein
MDNHEELRVQGTTGSSRRPPVFERDWTQGSTVRNLLSLAWPMIISQSLNMLGPTIDMIWVGKLGSASIAGVGVAGIAVGLVMSAMTGLMMGMRAMIARFIGANDVRGANHVAMQTFAVSAAFAILLAIIGIFLAESILGLFGLEADVIAEGAAYLRILFVCSVAMCLRIMAEGAMQASGDTQTPMRIAVLFRLFHVALCPFLIFGWWVFPRLGVSGAALTNVISQSLGLSISMWVLFSGRSRLRLTLRNFRLDPNIIWRIVRIGVPACIMGLQMSLGQFVLVGLMSPFGTDPVAAHAVCQRVELVLFMPILGMGMAAGVLAGQNLGAGRPERAEKSGWLAAGLAQAFMVICCLVLLIAAEKIMGIFSTEPGLVETGSTFLRIAAAGYLMIASVIVFQYCISGAGDTLPAMLFSVMIVWGVQMPLAFFLPRITDLGVYGVRWAMVAAIFVGMIVFLVYFRTGRWKRKKV